MRSADISDLQVRLDGRVAVITGGGSGIGAAVARLLHESGATVVLLDRNVEAARGVADALGDRAHAVECDVTDRASVEAAASSAREAAGDVDILVNSAGVALLQPAEELSERDWRATIDINLTGTFFVCQVFGQAMLDRGEGRIINLASQAATVALTDHVAYCASKFGVVGLTKVLASEWGPRGVTANTVSPTVVLTDLGRGAWENPKGEALKKQIPVERFAEPEEVAAVIAFLGSHASAMINGADILVDGGYTIR